MSGDHSGRWFEGRSTVTSVTNEEKHWSNSSVVINRPTCSAFSSLHFTDDPSHSVFSSSSAVQLQSSPAGLKRFTYKRLKDYFIYLFLLLFLPSCLVIVHCANYSVLCSFNFWLRCSEILIGGCFFFLSPHFSNSYCGLSPAPDEKLSTGFFKHQNSI